MLEQKKKAMQVKTGTLKHCVKTVRRPNRYKKNMRENIVCNYTFTVVDKRSEVFFVHAT